MRQALSKGLIVAAAATSALSLYGPWAYAAPRTHGTMVNSAAALAGRADPWDADGLDDLDGTFVDMHEKFGEMQDRFHELNDRLSAMPPAQPDFGSDIFEHSTSGHDNSGYGKEKPSGHGYGAEESKGHGYGYEKPKDHGYGHEKPKDEGYGHEKPKDDGYGYEKPSYGYGDEEPKGYGEEPKGYGDEEPKGYGEDDGYGEGGYGYGDEPKPPPPHKPEPTPPPSKTPPKKPDHPKMPETGTEGVVAGVAASGALLIAGTVLYRRNRAAARR